MLKSKFYITKKHRSAISYVWVGTLFGAVLGFCTQVLLARGLGAESYGAFSSALNLIGFLAPLAGFGVANYWLKSFGEEGWVGVRWLQPSFRFVIYTTLLVVFVVNLWAYYGPNDDVSRALLHFLSFTIISSLAVELVSAKFQLEERFALFSLFRVLPVMLRFVAVLFGVILMQGLASLEVLAKAYWFIAIVTSLLAIPELCRMWKGKILLQGHKLDSNSRFESDSLKVCDVLRETWVFGVAGVLYLVWGQGHVVLAKYVLGDHQAGIYSSALILINAICLLPSVGYSKFLLPKIHRWANHDLQKLKNVFQVGNLVMLLVGLGGLLVATFLSLWGVRLIFGEAYSQAEGVIFILGLTLPVRFLGYSVGSLLVTKRFMKLKVKVMLSVALLNIVMALLFMPHWGLHGLAWTVVACEGVLIFCYWRLVNSCYKASWA